MEHAAAVLSHVRLALVDVDVLYRQLETDFGTIQECRHLIFEAMAYHSLSPQTRQGTEWSRSRPRAHMNVKTLLALGTEARSLSAEGWKENDDVSVGRQVVAAAVVGNVLYMVCSPSSSSCFMSYDPTSNTFNTLSSPVGHSGEAQMVAVGARLFLVCGRQKKAWCFDIAIGIWTAIPPVAKNGRKATLASCQGAVLAIGGNHGMSATSTTAVQSFLPSKNSWETVSSTTVPHAGATAMVRGDIIYIGGGVTTVEGRTVNNTTVEMCRVFVKDDVTVSAWSVVPQPPCVRGFAYQVAVINRKAYFILGGQMHFTGKFVNPDRTSKDDVEEMCQAFRKDIQSGNVVCVTLSLKEKK